jgi:hypothetical protein
MSKIGIGVGEEFPVNDAKGPPTAPTGAPEGGNWGRRYWRRRRFLLHVLTRIAFVALVISAMVWMFYPAPYAQLPPYGYYPYHRHFWFFPFFPIFLIAFFAFAWRRQGCYAHHHHWHDHCVGDDREEA